LNYADDGDDCEKKLCVKKEAEGVVNVAGGGVVVVERMPAHKPDDCEEGGGGKDVMRRILLWNEYHAEYPAEEDENGSERPSLSLVFIKHGESGHDEHT